MLTTVLKGPTCAGRHKCIILCYRAEFWVPSTKCRNISCLLLTEKSLSPLQKKKKNRDRLCIYPWIYIAMACSSKCL